MIDITPYQERLQLCKEWLHLKIDGILPLIGDAGNEKLFIDIGCIPKVSWDEAIRLYEQTGNMFWNSNVPNNMHPASFEEYCNYKLTNK
jgi:hypothetical protein